MVLRIFGAIRHQGQKMKIKFNHRITLVDVKPSNSFSPEPSAEDEEELIDVWADVKTTKGEDYATNLTTETLNVKRFIIRYRPGITNKMKIRYKGQTYDIKSVINDNEANRTLTLVAQSFSN